MVRLDQRVLRLLAPALPSYGITAHYAQECPENPEINHVTVVCLERKNFGVLFDYVSTLFLLFSDSNQPPAVLY